MRWRKVKLCSQCVVIASFGACLSDDPLGYAGKKLLEIWKCCEILRNQCNQNIVRIISEKKCISIINSHWMTCSQNKLIRTCSSSCPIVKHFFPTIPSFWTSTTSTHCTSHTILPTLQYMRDLNSHLRLFGRARMIFTHNLIHSATTFTTICITGKCVRAFNAYCFLETTYACHLISPFKRQ
jgi:hypothetical protein